MKRVLCVEDDADLLELMAFIFEHAGYEVKTAKSGSEALLQLGTFPADVVLSDIRMPNGSGVDLLTSIQNGEASCQPPVVFITGYSDYSENQLKELGCAGLLVKPQDIENIVNKVAEVLATHSASN